MNSTSSDSGGFLGSYNIGGFGYGVGVSIGVLLLITIITLASYFCTRTPPPQPSHQRRIRRNTNSSSSQVRNAHLVDDSPSDVVVIEMGLDEATISSYPKFPYSEVKLKNNNKDIYTTSSCCSICLADYKNSDVLRCLPDCNHMFHVKCIDPWLLLHPTCPLCRTSPLPTPLATPLAEIVPLATRRDN